MPDKPATPIRTFRAPDEEWDLALRIAASRGETVTDVLRRALRRYIREADTEISEDEA
ncbi:hypothetical protein GCM10028801_41510 [Nocardioides maradonensis]